MLIAGAESNKNVHPILVDDDGRPYVNLNEPNPVEYDDTTAAHPKGIGIFGKWHTNNVWREMPVATHTDNMDNRGRYVIPVGTMTSERKEGTKITDGTTTAHIEPTSQGLTVSRALHKRIENSNQWLTSYLWGDVAAAGDVYLLLKVAAGANAHISITIMTEAKAYWWLYETPDINTEGTAVDRINVNRQTATASTMTVFRDTTVNALGTLLETGMLGSPGKWGDIGGSAPTAGYWLLKKSTNYLIRIDNLDEAVKDLAVNVTWHES